MSNDGMEFEHHRMTILSGMIDHAFNPMKGPPKTCFVLLVAEFGQITDGRVNFASNGRREDVIAMMKEYIARHEGRYHEAGGNA